MQRLLALVFILASTVLGQSSQAAIIEGFPDGIICSVKDPTGFLPWEELVFYVSAYTRDGETLYKTLTSDPVVIIVNREGVLQAANLADCDGRNVAELIEAERAFYLTPANDD